MRVPAAVFAAAAATIASAAAIEPPAIQDLSAIKLDPRVVETNVKVGEHPFDIAMTPDAATAWVTAFSTNEIYEIRKRVVARKLEVGSEPTGIALSADGKTLFVGLSASDSLAFVDVETWTVTETIPLCNFPIGVRVSPDGKWVGVACQSNELVIVPATGTTKGARLIQRASIGERPYFLAFAPDSRRVWVPGHGTNDLSVVRIEPDGKPVLESRIPVGAEPVGVAVSKERGTVWVANWSSATVTQIDPKKLEVVATHPVGTNPYMIASSAACDCMLVTNFGSDTLDVLHEGRGRTRIKVGDSIVNVYPSPDGKRLFATAWNHAIVKIIE